MLGEKGRVVIFYDGVEAVALEPLEVIVDVEIKALFHLRKEFVFIHHGQRMAGERAERGWAVGPVVEDTATVFARSIGQGFVLESVSTGWQGDHVRHIDDGASGLWANIDQRLVHALPGGCRGIRHGHADALVVAVDPPFLG